MNYIENKPFLTRMQMAWYVCFFFLLPAGSHFNLQKLHFEEALASYFLTQ